MGQRNISRPQIMGKGGLITTNDFLFFQQTWYTLLERGVGGLKSIHCSA